MKEVIMIDQFMIRRVPERIVVHLSSHALAIKITTRASMQSTDHHYMSRALELAKLGRFTATPNPMVGSVIVRDGEIVGEGYHEKAGSPHAEINALGAAGDAAKNATMYVTLEPCCHHGKTPPCTDTLIKSGIKKIVVACLDPNPQVSGQGIERLKAAGIDIELGLMEKEALALNEIFIHFMTKKRPYVIAKWAMSLDGQTITHPADDRQISNYSSQQHAHHTRYLVDAILVGKNTIVQDNPQLTVRHVENASRHPARVIMTTHGDIPLHSRVLQNMSLAKTIIVATDHIRDKQHATLTNIGVEIIIANKTTKNKIDVQHMLQLLAKNNITSLLVEGGKQTHDSFFANNLVDKIDVYLAPVIISQLSKKATLSSITIHALNEDYYLTANTNFNEERSNV